MKFTCEHARLVEIMAVMNSIAPAHSNIPVIQNVKISGSSETPTVSFSATDYEIGIIATLPVEDLTAPQGVLVNAHTLYGALSNEKSEKITFETTENELILSTVRSRLVFALCQETFAEIKDIDINEPVYSISTANFRYALERTKFAVENIVGRYAFNGIHFNIKNQKIDFAASDGKRLSVVKKNLLNEENSERQVTVPPKGLIDFFKFINSEEILLQLTDKEMVAKTGDIRFFSRLLEGKFPDYNRVIPVETNIVIKVLKNEFLDGLKLVRNFCLKEEPYVGLKAANDKLVITAKTSIGKGKNEIEAKISGGEIDLIFNVSYLIDVASALLNDEISLNFQQNDKPLLIVEDDFTHVLSPVAR